MITVKAYHPDLSGDWRLVLENSVNGTFIHARSYLEYHGDRFRDFSLVIYHKNKPVGIFPANRAGDQVYSHQGLTYGGPVIISMGMEVILLILEAIIRYYRSCGIREIIIKEIPSFYAKSSMEWMAYGMFCFGAVLKRRDLTLAVSLPTDKSKYTKGKRWDINKAERSGLTIREGGEFKEFWEKLLVPNLWARHQVRPVHTLEEILWLKNHNDPNIRQFNVYYQEEIVAGATVYVTDTTAHTQYLASSPLGKKTGALSLLMHYLMTKVFAHQSYFDFGTVNEQEGEKINKGLMEWKESFGARPYVHAFYEIDTGNYRNPEGIFLEKRR